MIGDIGNVGLSSRSSRNIGGRSDGFGGSWEVVSRPVRGVPLTSPPLQGAASRCDEWGGRAGVHAKWSKVSARMRLGVPGCLQ